MNSIGEYEVTVIFYKVIIFLGGSVNRRHGEL